MEEFEAGPQEEGRELKKVSKGISRQFAKKKGVQTTKRSFESGLDAVKEMARLRGEKDLGSLELRRRANAQKQLSSDAKLVFLAMKVNGFKKVKSKDLADSLSIGFSDVIAATRELRNVGLMVSPREDYHHIEVSSKGDFVDGFGEVKNG